MRGLNRSFKQGEVRAMVMHNHVALLGINETRVKRSGSDRIVKDILRGWQFIHNYERHRNGRIWVLWDPGLLDVKVILSTSQMIHVEVTIIQSS